jgi:hypothetical protein
LKRAKTPQADNKMSNASDHTPVKDSDVILQKKEEEPVQLSNATPLKSINELLLERDRELIDATVNRPAVSVLTVMKDSHPAEKPVEVGAPQAVFSNIDPNGAPLSIAYDLPLTQTVDFFVESSNYAVADIVTSLKDFGIFSNSAPNATLDTVQPANDALNTAMYSKFETDNLTNAMTDVECSISNRTDGEGNHHYLFENKENSTHVVLLKVKEKYMVKVNNLLMPLDRFLTLKQCVSVPMETTVSCTFEDDSVVQITNVSVDLMMLIVAHLAKVNSLPLPVSPPTTPVDTPVPTPPVSGSTRVVQGPTCWEIFVATVCCRGRGFNKSVR